MKEYNFDKKVYSVQITLTGVFCIAIALFCAYSMITTGTIGIYAIGALVAIYTAWNDFVSISNPEKVTLADDYIAFTAYGREHKYMREDIEEFRLREFPSAGKIYIRLNKSNIFKGRYWVHCKLFDDGEELFTRLRDMEYEIHPDSLKAKARTVNTEYIKIGKKNKKVRIKQR